MVFDSEASSESNMEEEEKVSLQSGGVEVFMP